MTDAEETSFMTTFITVFFGGVISALITLLLGQPLQHYFWRRQQHAARQLAIIEEMNRLAAEVFGAFGNLKEMHDIQRRVPMTLAVITGQVKAMFSESGLAGFMIFMGSMGLALEMTEKSSPEQWSQAGLRLHEAHAQALIALYHDMGIPPLSWRQWMRERVWRPKQTWHERWQPQLKWLLGQARTRIRR